MNIVQPIKDKDIISEIKRRLKQENIRNYILFLMGIYTGLRVSDILRIKVGDVEGWYITMREKKTKKFKRIHLNSELKRELKEFTKDMETHEYLIRSRQGINKPITRGMAYIILRELADEFDIECIGTHSLRKTFGYWFYKSTKDVAALQKIFNHTSPKETLRYIGIEQENIDEMMKKFKI
jgi:integrase